MSATGAAASGATREGDRGAPGAEDPQAHGSDRAALRGSVLFLVGRVASMGLSLIAQVIIVRTLAKDDFGSFAYALALAALIQSFLALGLDRADTFFLTRFDEDRDTGRLVGLLVVELSVVAVAGGLAIGLLWAVGSRIDHGAPLAVVLLLVATAPLMAIDTLVLNAFAVFAEPRAIFLRRYVLDPVLRLSVVGVLALSGMALLPLAVGYLVAAGAGTLLYLVLLVRLVRRVVARHGARPALVWPGGQVFRHALPLLLVAVVYAATTSLPTLMLQQLGSLDQVAELRAVQPVAALILVVPTVFGTLFLPRAARLSSRGDDAGLRRHYWSTAVSVAVLAFPAVVLLTAFAPVVTRTLFGARYAEAAGLMTVMALAFYANAALGLNGSLLQVTGRVRLLVISSLAGLVAAPLTGVLLIPTYGALGAAWAVVAALGVPQLVKQVSLTRTPVGGANRTAVKLWSCAGLLLLAAAAVPRLGATGLVAAGVTTVLCWGVLLLAMRRELVAADLLPGRFRARRKQAGPGVPDAADPEPGPQAGSALPGTWACLDWRFLGESVRTGTVLVLEPRPVVVGALTAVGAQVALLDDGRAEPAAPDVVLTPVGSCTPEGLATVRRVLGPDGRLVVEVDRRPSGRSRRAALRPWTTVTAALRAAGFEVSGTYAALPNLARTSAFVDRSQKVALVAALRRQPVQPVKRAAANVAVLLVHLGLDQLVCRYGVVVARPVPPSRPEQPR